MTTEREARCLGQKSDRRLIKKGMAGALVVLWFDKIPVL
jgi:hypothetical protein